MTTVTPNGKTYTFPEDFEEYSVFTTLPNLISDTLVEVGHATSAAAVSVTSASQAVAALAAIEEAIQDGPVLQVNGHVGIVVLDAASVGALPASTTAAALGALPASGGTMTGTLTMAANIDMGGNDVLDVGQSNSLPLTLTFGSTVTPSFGLRNNFELTATGNFTLATPSNALAGQSFSIRISQDATGSRTWSLSSFYKFPGGTVPTLTTAANANDRLVGIVDAGGTTATCQVLKDVR